MDFYLPFRIALNPLRISPSLKAFWAYACPYSWGLGGSPALVGAGWLPPVSWWAESPCGLRGNLSKRGELKVSAPILLSLHASGSIQIREPYFMNRIEEYLRGLRRTWPFLILIGILAGVARPQEKNLPPQQTPAPKVSQDLGQMSIEDLMTLSVTSGAKKEEPVRQTAAAIFVITSEDIRRSGAATLPDVLRIVPGMDVAQISGTPVLSSVATCRNGLTGSTRKT